MLSEPLFLKLVRFIYEIHKGLDPRETARNPALVNKFIPVEMKAGTLLVIGATEVVPFP